MGYFGSGNGYQAGHAHGGLLMKQDVIQTSFSAGEFGPSLLGRTDIAQYANACEIVENFLPRPYGSVISTPGTRYVATVSDSTLRTRLIKFVFNRLDAYAIEMGDLYMRFFTNRGQVVTKTGTEDLSAFSANLKAHWKCNDNVGGTGTTTVLDAVGSYNGTATTVTSSLSTTAIVSTGFNLGGIHHISISDADDFTRTVSTQPMTILGWFYYLNNGGEQCFVSKAGEYELSIDSSNKLSFIAYSGNADTKLLLHCDGTDGSTTFTDSSSGAKTVTANGDAQIDTAQKVFGTGAALFDGTGDYLSVPDDGDWDFGTGDFTIDFRVRFDGAPVAGDFIDRNSTSDFNILWNGTNLILQLGGSAVVTVAWSPTADTWYHIAATRQGSTAYLFLNGVLQGSASNSTNIDSATAVNIGRRSNDVGYLKGWMDEVRIVKGTAIWTANFTVPDAAYGSAVSNSWKVNDSIATGWNFVSAVFAGTGDNNSDCTLYINGLLAEHTFASDAGFVKMENTTSLFRIGTTSSAAAKNWNSKLDNIAFIHQALTAANIASLYSTSPYQITTVFTENEVFDVHYAQLNDVIWLSHPNHPPQKLVRTSANEWAIADHAFIGGPFLDSNTVTSTTLSVSATLGTINLTAATGKVVFTRSGSTLGHHNAYWAVGGLSLTNSTTDLEETGYVKITHVINSYTATATVIKSLKALTATDNWAEGAWSAVRGYPSRVILQGNRLWYGRTNHEPQKEWGSRVFAYDDFALDTEADDDGLNLGLSSNESNEIQWLSAGKSLLAGTFGGVFVTNSGSTEPVTPNNVTASEEIGLGGEDLMPKKVGNFLYYVQRFGKKLRELFYNFELDAYKSVDRTILAPHILGDGVVDMDVQNNPETIFYCVLTSGTLATLTREIDQEVSGWARQTTSGTYSSVAVIPSQSANYDEAWVIVERFINGNKRKYVEYFENIEVPTRQDQCLYLHSALTYDAYESTSSSNVTISLSASSGSITLTASTAYFSGGMINKRLRVINNSLAGTTVGEGVVTATASTTSITLSITTTFNALSYVAGLWGVSVSTISGLDHLAGKTLGILADGITESLTRTVASGAVTLGSNYFVISAGLSYDQLLFTLPKEAAAQRGTAQAKWQRYSEIAFKVNRSTQNFKYGPDASNLDDINLAITPTVTSLYTGILPPQGGGIAMRGGYKRGAQVYIKNTQPLPIEILNIIGALDTNEK